MGDSNRLLTDAHQPSGSPAALESPRFWQQRGDSTRRRKNNDPGCSSALDMDEDHNGECVDDTDNEGDGWIDLDDTDCTSEFDFFEDGGLDARYECSDGEDNDEDGFIDAEDPGCGTGSDDAEEDPSTECNDGIDNDEDGWTDLDDPICTGITVELEDDGFDPDGPACNDGIDNDADGETDSEDPGCSSASDDNEVG